MNKTTNSQHRLILHWWNFGRKKLDYDGTISGYLKEKGFKVKAITHPIQKDITGYRFKFSLSSTTCTLDIYHKFEQAALEAIKIFLTILGDKALIASDYGQRRVNH